MTPNAHYLLLLFAIGVFATIVDVVRRRKLDNFFSTVWVLGGLGFFCLLLRRDLLKGAAASVGADSEGLFLAGLACTFLIAMALFLTIRAHDLAARVEKLEQLLGQREPQRPEDRR